MVAQDGKSLTKSHPDAAGSQGKFGLGWMLVVTVCLLLTAGVPARLSAQLLPVDTASLGRGPASHMQMLWEKTIFQVDVLWLELRFDTATTRRFAMLVDGRQRSSALTDSIAALALYADDVWAHLRFERDVSLSQFVDGVRHNAAAARDAGIITEPQFNEISESLPRWYAFLDETGIKDGDEMFYRIRGDTLRTIYRTRDGTTRLDQTDVGAFRRLSVMGGYFAPKSDFRKQLVTSLFNR